MSASDYYRLQVGQFDCLFIRDGSGPRTVASFLPDAPQDEVERIIRARNFDPQALDFAITPILIKTGSQFVLIDTGEGGDRSNLPAHLHENGVVPEEIGLIVITHGHGDHVNGILDTAGKFVFPNATYVLSRAEWEYGTAEDRFAPTDTSHSKLVWQTLKAHSQRVRLLDERNPEIAPGICAVPAPGHTIGHIAVELESDGEKLLHVADAAHHSFQVACPQWSPKFDHDKAQAAETRRALLERAVHEDTLFSAYHFSFPGVGRIVEQGGEFTWQQVG